MPNKSVNKSQQELLKKIEELENQLKKIKKQKKYGLVWENKPEEFEEKAKNSLPILEAKESGKWDIQQDKNLVQNILIEGDNYHSLSVLSYTHRGKIDVIYIDPPYNTGSTDWKYNNNYVDKDDFWRHSKWLSFIEKRLRIAKELLKTDGIICITIDDYELPRLWILMEEIFGNKNHLGTISIRNNPKGRKTTRKVSLTHEYAILFGKSDSSKVKKLPVKVEEKTHNYKKDENGEWYLPVNMRKQGVDSEAVKTNGKVSDRFYPIYFDPNTGEISTKKKLQIEILPIDSNNYKRIWRRGKEAIDAMYKNGDLWCNKTKNGLQVYFKFRGGLDGEPPQSIWVDSKFSASEHGTKTLDSIMGQREVFSYPKSPHAVKECILISSNKESAVILDFFAGSGTTGHAVLELNKEDGGNRQFIVCTNNESKICEEVTYERLKRVMTGYKNPKGAEVEGLGGNLKYLKTEFLPRQNAVQYTDEDKLELTQKVGCMLALKENTFEETMKSGFYQTFEGEKQVTGIYFREDKGELSEYIEQITQTEKQVKIYIFSWMKGEYKNSFSEYKNLTCEDIPEPILEVYKSIGL
jgi:adenine-specific DNA-methyltransferase